LIAVDSNILVYAHRVDADWHLTAKQTILELAEGRTTWGIPWPCIHEFLAVVSHPRIYNPPSTTRQAIEQVETWLSSPSVVVIGESQDHWDLLKAGLTQGQIKGPMVHDARISAICQAHGVTEFFTADRDFSRFPLLSTRNPLL
jgi:hypothetical protein|tara:strand:+ start:115 stop:546 length:432 start_codon:yes stop_codon:yes gene_type:complete